MKEIFRPPGTKVDLVRQEDLSVLVADPLEHFKKKWRGK
jgi:hypothetical protein